MSGIFDVSDVSYERNGVYAINDGYGEFEEYTGDDDQNNIGNDNTIEYNEGNEVGSGDDDMIDKYVDEILDMDALDIKDDLMTKYSKSLKFNTSSKTKEIKRHSGNTTSSSGSRPLSHKKWAQDLKDVVNYNAVDYIQTNVAYRKTAAPKIVQFTSYDKSQQSNSLHDLYAGEDNIHQPVNTQQHYNVNYHHGKNYSQLVNNKQVQLIVELESIRPLLFLSNINTVLNYPSQDDITNLVTNNSIKHDWNDKWLQSQTWFAGLKQGKYMFTKPHIIINLSNKKLYVPSYKIYDITMRDCRKIDYKQFCNHIQKINDIISSYPDSPITVCCERGVNRSVAMIVGYAITNNIKSYKDTITYIERQKQQSYGQSWSSLNNLTFVRYLETISNNYYNI